MRCESPLQMTLNPLDPYGTPISRKFEKRLCELLKDSLVLNYREKSGPYIKIACVCECCRIKHDKYFPSVELPARKVRRVSGKVRRVRGNKT